MKKYLERSNLFHNAIFTFAFVLCAFALGAPAVQAAPKGRIKAESTEPVLRDDSEARSFSSSKARFGLGLSSMDKLTGAPTALSGWIELDSKNAVQAFFALPGTSPSFQFSIAAAYKHVFAESGGSSFHVGAGLGMGSLGTPRSEFALSFGGILGVRQRIASSPLFVSFDAGPVFQIVRSTTDFSIGAMSALLGASVIYVF